MLGMMGNRKEEEIVSGLKLNFKKGGLGKSDRETVHWNTSLKQLYLSMKDIKEEWMVNKCQMKQRQCREKYGKAKERSWR